MIQLSAQEAHLVDIARALFRLGSFNARALLLSCQPELPQQISPDAMLLVQETLSQGMALTVMQRGGHRRTKRITKAGVKAQRITETYPELRLRFGPFSFEIIAAIARSGIGRGDKVTTSPPETWCDHVVSYLVAELASEAGLELDLGKACATRTWPLALVGFPAIVSTGPVALTGEVFGSLLKGEGYIAVEAMGDALATRLADIQTSLLTVVLDEGQIRTAEHAEKIWKTMVDALVSKGRLDLLGFVIEAGRMVLQRHTRDSPNVSVPAKGAMAARVRARRAAGVLFRVLSHLETVEQDAVAARFFDEEYEMAQLFLGRLERLGETGLARAAAVVSYLESLEGLENASRGDS